MRRFLLLAIVLVFAAAIWWLWPRHQAPVPKTVMPVAVTVATVHPGTLERWVPVVGSLVARDELVVATEGIGGRIAELLVDVGERVAAGQIVARIDASAAEVGVAQAEAGLQRARAVHAQQQAVIGEAAVTAADAEAAVKRAEAAGSSVFSEEARAQRQTALASARARMTSAQQALALAETEIAQAEVQLRSARLDLSRTTLVAPAAGLVLERPARLGAVANPGEALFKLARNGDIEFAAEVTEDLLALIAPGQPVTLQAGGVSGTGSVRRVDPAVASATRLGVARITLDLADGLVRPGLSGRGRIHVATGTGLLLPTSAVIDGEDGASVLVLRGGFARRQAVVISLRADGQALLAPTANRVEPGPVLEGLVDGDHVVARSANFIPDGEAVTAVPAESR